MKKDDDITRFNPRLRATPLAYPDKVGRPRIKSLFIETLSPEAGINHEPVFKLMKATESDLPWFWARYHELEDPLGAQFAVETLGSVEALEALKNNTLLKDHWKTQYRELVARLRSKALEDIRYLAEAPETPPAQRLAANKMLLSCCWEEATGGEKKEQEAKGKRGRPSSVEVDALKMQLAQETAEIDEDYKRVLKLVPK